MTYEWLLPASEGLIAAKKNGKWGFINTSNEVIIPFQYDNALSFSNGKAIVTEGKERWFINSANKKLERMKTHKEIEHEFEEKRERLKEKQEEEKEHSK